MKQVIYYGGAYPKLDKTTQIAERMGFRGIEVLIEHPNGQPHTDFKDLPVNPGKTYCWVAQGATLELTDAAKLNTQNKRTDPIKPIPAPRNPVTPAPPSPFDGIKPSINEIDKQSISNEMSRAIEAARKKAIEVTPVVPVVPQPQPEQPSEAISVPVLQPVTEPTPVVLPPPEQPNEADKFEAELKRQSMFEQLALDALHYGVVVVKDPHTGRLYMDDKELCMLFHLPNYLMNNETVQYDILSRLENIFADAQKPKQPENTTTEPPKISDFIKRLQTVNGVGTKTIEYIVKTYGNQPDFVKALSENQPIDLKTTVVDALKEEFLNDKTA